MSFSLHFYNSDVTKPAKYQTRHKFRIKLLLNPKYHHYCKQGGSSRCQYVFTEMVFLSC